ncbi:precorrin-3B synthase [Bradyrhizobium sp. HKCCYLS20291]|uniref:precorrin-3B synthase n=1 Tax=Bradyrhizobium sp. HKCCYLS20291 TaxID=3420766 RepID=UPI003EC09672
MTAAVEIKGWCPGARRPMPSGDGLVVRVRPHGGTLSIQALRELAEAARRFGNGQIDLTRRANLQIRGVSSETLTPLWALMDALALLDDSAEIEAIRNIVINPLAGLDPAEIIDMRPVAAALEQHLAADQTLHGLPAKFGFALDGGGRLPLTGLAADIQLKAVGRDGERRMAVGLDREDGVLWLGTTARVDSVGAAMRLAHHVLSHSPTRRAVTLPSDAIDAVIAELRLDASTAMAIDPAATAQQRRGLIALTGQSSVIGIGVPFGRVDSATLTQLADRLAERNVSEVRLSPWRTLYVAADRALAERIITDAAGIGLIVDDADPLMRIDACSGAGCCASTELATRQHARVLAAAMARTRFAGTLHVSGCAKGCARSAPANVLLVGKGSRYHVVRNGTVRSAAQGVLDPAVLDVGASALFETGEKVHV